MVSTCMLFVCPDDYDGKDVGPENVRTVFIVRLPFRVRSGTIRRLKVDADFEVTFRNGINIPTGTSYDEASKLGWVGKQFRPREEFMTDAMILDRRPPVKAEEAAAFGELARAETTEKPSYKER